MAEPENSSRRARRLVGPADVATPFVRAREYLRTPVEQFDELPVARPTIAVARQVFHDELVLLGMRMFLPAGDAYTPERIEREVTAALEFYGQRGWLENPEEFFAAPPGAHRRHDHADDDSRSGAAAADLRQRLRAASG